MEDFARHDAERDEKALLESIDEDYIWSITARLSDGGEVVAGTEESLQTAQWLAEEMAALGLEPGLEGGSYIEDFTIFGWEEIETSVALLTPEQRSIPCKQNYKGDGTGPAGVTAPVVFIGEGHWDDFESADVAGKIILFHRTEPLFWGNPVLLEAKSRGAVGALMDWPPVQPTGLKTDCIANSIPTAYIRGRDAAWIEGELAGGREVTARLVVNNRTGHYPQAHNVLGVIHGRTYPDEYVYLTAHFDHWFAAACDDCAGVGSLLGVAKALRDSGCRPERTFVFAIFDSEELGAPNDTWYDWIIGSYSHAVATLRTDGTWGPPLHPDLPGKVAAMLNLDIVGVRGGEVFCETSPELTRLMQQAADDSGLSAGASTHVYWPPGSYDDCSFFIAGMPVMQLAWFGPAYEGLYHTSDDTLDKIDPVNLRLTTAFTLLAADRLARPGVLPYDLRESARVAQLSMERLVASHPELAADAGAHLDELRHAVGSYLEAVGRFEATAHDVVADPEAYPALNRTLMAASKALGTTLYHWDLTSVPGWENLTLFDTCAHDLLCLKRALARLRAGDASGAASELEDVMTMGWGRHLGARAYADVLATMAEPATGVWGAPFIPFVTNVHQEHASLMHRPGAERMGIDECIASLERRAGAIRLQVGKLATEAAGAFEEAAGFLSET